MKDLLRQMWEGLKMGLAFTTGVAVFIAALALLGVVLPSIYGTTVTYTPAA